MHKLYYLLLFLFLSLNVQAQKQTSDFIQTSKKSLYGIKLIKGTPKENALFIRQEKAIQDIEYTTEDIIAYGFVDGTFFKRFEIPVEGKNKAFFFEEIVNCNRLHGLKEDGYYGYFHEVEYKLGFSMYY